MLGTQSVKNYFENNTTETLPLISAEWNYNLVYNTYVSFSGTGQNIAPSLSSTAGWNTYSNPKLTLNKTTDGYSTSAFTDLSSIQFGVNVTTVENTSDVTNFQAKASLNIALPKSAANCYKVVFYARSLTTDTINLSTNISATSSNLNATSFASIDNFTWQKVTAIAGVRPTDNPYNNFDLTLDFTNTTLSSNGIWGLEICHLEIYQITYFDYCYGNLWPTDSIFTYFRPGESYVTSGNASISNVTRQVTKMPGDYNTPFPSQWTNAMPCSPIVYSPKTLFSANSNPLYKNGLLSPLSKYNYFVSEVPNGATSVGAAYEEILKSNKIIIKFNLSQSIPDNFTVSLYNGSTSVSTTTFDSSAIQASGLCELYWSGSAWTTTKWTWAPDATSQMPTINSAGQISKYQSFNKIVVTQTSSTPISNYQTMTYNASNSATVLSEFKRMQVVEISPRLELDLSAFIVEYDIQKTFDAKNTPLPISSMSANTATIHLSNIPLSGTNNYPLSIFSTNANDANYTTPLKNLIVKNVKFYVNYYIPDTTVDTQANRIIPGGVFYVDTWDNTDLKVAKANCLDVVKFLQTISVNDYVSHEQGLVNIFTNIMDSSGFTDYNLDELTSVLTDNNQVLTAGYFYADSANKTIYDVLHEAFMAYQVGSYIDEFGVLRFKNLKNIISSNISVHSITDSSIVVDTYNETIKSKPGKLRMLYREPQRKMSVWTSSLALQNSNTTILSQAPDVVWKQDTEDLVPFNYLIEPITSFSQNYYRVDPNSLSDPFYTTVFDHDSYAIIEGEIISTGDKEWSIVSDNGVPTFIHIASQADYNNKLAQFTNAQGSANITQSPTGRFVNVKRGLFGTAATTHYPLTKDVSSKMQCYTYAAGTSTFSLTQPFSISSSTGLIQVPIFSSGATAVMLPTNQSDQGYYTYSTKLRFPNVVPGNYISAGIQMGISSSLGNSNAFFVEIKAVEGKTNKYLLNYGVGGVASGTVDITNILNADFNNEPVLPLYAVKEKGLISLKLTEGAVPRKDSNNNYVYQTITAPDGTTYKDFVYDNHIVIYINNHRINTYLSSDILAQVGTKFGVYAHGDGSASSTVEFAEIYACETALDDKISYHFQSFNFLDNLVANKRIIEKFCMIQAQPQIIGLNLYDVQLSTTPSSGVEPLKVMYNLYYTDPNAVLNPNNTSNSTSNWISVYDDAIQYSSIASTGFRAKFALVNNSPYSVWTKTGTEDKQAVSAQFALFSRNMIVLTDQQTIERILNPQNINEVIELQSDWVQSKNSAESILKVLSDATDAFSKDIQITVFGDPLIQVGDVVSLTYSLKNMVNLNFFVQSVTQTFKQGLVTELILNQITYNGTGVDSKPTRFPYPTAISSNTSAKISLSPAFGSVTGGDVITITGGSGFTSSSLPTVFFGTQQAYNVTYVNPTTVTVQTPPHAAGAVNITLAFGSTIYTTANYYGYTYKAVAPTVGAIIDLYLQSSYYDPTNKNQDVYLNWTQPTNSNLFDYTLTGGATQRPDNRSGVNLTYPDPSSVYKLAFSGAGITGDPLTINGGGLENGQTYTVTVTPKNSTNGVVTSGKAMTFNFVAGNITATPNVPAIPVLTTNYVPYTTNSDGTITMTLTIIPDSSGNPPTSYKIQVNPDQAGTPNTTAIFTPQVSQLTKDGSGNYVYVIGSEVSNTKFAAGQQYAVNIYALNSAGQSDISPYTTAAVTQSNAPTPTNVSVTPGSNITVNWTGNSAFSSYLVNYTGSVTGPAVGEPPFTTTDNINFTDTTYQGLFKPGEIVEISVQPFLAGLGSIPGNQSATISYTIPTQTTNSGGSTYINPTPDIEFPYAENYHEDSTGKTVHATGGSFWWFGADPAGDFNSYTWQWELRRGSSSSGTLLSSSSLSSPNGGSGRYYIVQTSNTGQLYFRIRQVVIGKDGNTYNGAWESATGTFT